MQCRRRRQWRSGVVYTYTHLEMVRRESAACGKRDRRMINEARNTGHFTRQTSAGVHVSCVLPVRVTVFDGRLNVLLDHDHGLGLGRVAVICTPRRLRSPRPFLLAHSPSRYSPHTQ